jgi:ribosome-binding protein aMBF1 (putative translation factor)
MEDLRLHMDTVRVQQHGGSYQTWASAIGVDADILRKIYRGERRPKADTLKKMGLHPALTLTTFESQSVWDWRDPASNPKGKRQKKQAKAAKGKPRHVGK